jgi:hypothetical protein
MKAVPFGEYHRFVGTSDILKILQGDLDYKYTKYYNFSNRFIFTDLLERYLDFLEVSFIADNRYRYFVIISWKE